MKAILLALLCAFSFSCLGQEKTISIHEQQQKLAAVQAEIIALSEKIDRVQLRLNELEPEEVPAEVSDELELMKNQLISKKRVEYSIKAYLESIEEDEKANDKE